MTNSILTINEGGNNINFNGKMLSGKYKQMKFLFFPDIQEFSFPLKQISSIRFYSERDIKVKSVIIAIVLLLIGLATMAIGVGFIFLGIGAYMLYQNFKPLTGIKIYTTGGDNELFIIKKSKNTGQAKEMISLVNEKIADL